MDLGHPFHTDHLTQHILHEPVGVAALITPWNWPLAQVTLKLGAALAAGCTAVLKPSEISPLVAIQLAEAVAEIGAPAGVFNLLQGDGATVGAPLTSHPLVGMVSFTGSTRAGRAISTVAAQTIKRVILELGGKSPNIIFADAELESAVDRAVGGCFHNTGQNCNAPTRLLVEASVYDEVLARIAQTASAFTVDLPDRHGDHLGPLISQTQMMRVESYISGAITEGARILTGGVGRPDGVEKGWFVRPTVFADVTETMTIWREEVFGPVLSVTPFKDEADALRMANDTDYGLAAFINSSDMERCRRVACALRVGMVHINGAPLAAGAPFGGVKQSGNGREGGAAGISEFLETKAVAGW
jgi:aldehyde dehydrogenase (NAD+)